MKINVLITGAGGNLAHFISRALEYSNLDLNIVACDYSSNAVGLYKAKTGYVVYPAKHENYINKIIEICKNENIHIIMVGGMAEMRVLAKNKDYIKDKTGAIVVSCDAQLLNLMEDKWETVQCLKKVGYEFPYSVLPSNKFEYEMFLKNFNFPYVVKDRLGAGSQGVAIAHNMDELNYLIKKIPNAVIQEYLYPDDEEYTVGVYISSYGNAIGSIVMKRQLGLGMTSKAQIIANTTLGSYCEEFLEKVGYRGPGNVQLRVTDRGPVIFEVNPRFSSTTSARPHYGYNDPDMCIRDLILGEKLSRPKIKEGRFFRVIEEVFVEEKEISSLEKNKIRREEE